MDFWTILHQVGIRLLVVSRENTEMMKVYRYKVLDMLYNTDGFCTFLRNLNLHFAILVVFFDIQFLKMVITYFYLTILTSALANVSLYLTIQTFLVRILCCNS